MAGWRHRREDGWACEQGSGGIRTHLGLYPTIPDTSQTSRYFPAVPLDPEGHNELARGRCLPWARIWPKIYAPSFVGTNPPAVQVLEQNQAPGSRLCLAVWARSRDPERLSLLLHSKCEELCVRSKPRVRCRSMGYKWIWTNLSFLIFLLWYLLLAEKSLFSGAVIQSIILYHTIKIFRVFADLCSLKLNSLGWCENSAQLFTKSDSCFWYSSTSSVLTWMSWN